MPQRLEARKRLVEILGFLGGGHHGDDGQKSRIDEID
jgi:hypothetical protein